MAGQPLFILLCSAEHEKIQMAAMLASVAAVSDRPVTLFVSMGALPVFQKGLSPDEAYKGGSFSKILRDKGAPDAITLFGQGKMLGEMTVLACSMALDVLGWELEDLTEDLFDEPGGLTKFLNDAEDGQLVTL
ncbi:MAG: hypothetical protein H6907_07985 [Hyphomicrobiales bacterium]|nr:hypothetical protein [Hyphomicrobiales bacterium]MCP5371659.1 hypothetical protein [Hyphomicrobiales bacterium]